MRSSTCILMGASVCFLSAGCATYSSAPARGPSPEALKLAESGDAMAQCEVGWSYSAAKNYAEAARWLQRSNNLNAQGSLAWLFLRGNGVPMDVRRGMEHLRVGADSPPVFGTGECAEDLAEIYRKGSLVPRNYAEAYYYFGVAVLGWPEESLTCCNAARNLYLLVERRKTVGRKLTSAERSAQDERLQKWANQHMGQGWRLSERIADRVGVQVPKDTDGNTR